MNGARKCWAVRREQGFDVYAGTTPDLEIAVVPELGARIISLRSRHTGREWLWHPIGGRNLFRNRAGDAFERSPLVGVDECCPTIAPCSWLGRQLPDHGELWSAPWTVEDEAWKCEVLRTRAEMTTSPFDFERTIELRNNEVRLSYRLINRSSADELFLWAMHPLLRLQTGDELQLPASTRALLTNSGWTDALDTACPTGHCKKVFAWPVTDGVAAIVNSKTGDRLAFEWDATVNNTLGLWLTRGGWHGHHHFALEPSNGAPDALSEAAQSNRCGSVMAHSSVEWQINLRIGA